MRFLHPATKGPQGTKPSADKDFSHTGADAPTPTSRLQTSRTGNKPSVDISLKPPATAGCRRSSDWRTSTDFPTTTGQGSQAVRGQQLGLHLPRPQVVGRICMGAPTQTSRPQRGTRENRPSVDISQEKEGPRPQPQASARPEPKETNHKPNHKTKKTNKTTETRTTTKRKHRNHKHETQTNEARRQRNETETDATKPKRRQPKPTERNKQNEAKNQTQNRQTKPTHEGRSKDPPGHSPERTKRGHNEEGGPKTPVTQAADTTRQKRRKSNTCHELRRAAKGMSHLKQTRGQGHKKTLSQNGPESTRGHIRNYCN